MMRMTKLRGSWVLIGVLTGVALPPDVLAGPNITAIGNYRALPFKRAEGRDSFSGKEVIFSFSDPEFDFGRVVVQHLRHSFLNETFVRDLGESFFFDDLRGVAAIFQEFS